MVSSGQKTKQRFETQEDNGTVLDETVSEQLDFEGAKVEEVEGKSVSGEDTFADGLGNEGPTDLGWKG